MTMSRVPPNKLEFLPDEINKKKIKPNLLLWFIEDDDTYFGYRKKDILSFDKNCKIVRFGCIEDALDKSGRPDVAFIDVSTLNSGSLGMGIGGDRLYHFNIRNFCKAHTSTKILLYSAVKRWANVLIEDVKKDNPESLIERISFDMDKETIFEVLKEFK